MDGFPTLEDFNRNLQRMHKDALDGLAAARQGGSAHELAEWEAQRAQIEKMLKQAGVNPDA